MLFLNESNSNKLLIPAVNSSTTSQSRSYRYSSINTNTNNNNNIYSMESPANSNPINPSLISSPLPVPPIVPTISSTTATPLHHHHNNNITNSIYANEANSNNLILKRSQTIDSVSPINKRNSLVSYEPYVNKFKPIVDDSESDIQKRSFSASSASTSTLSSASPVYSSSNSSSHTTNRDDESRQQQLSNNSFRNSSAINHTANNQLSIKMDNEKLISEILFRNRKNTIFSSHHQYSYNQQKQQQQHSNNSNYSFQKPVPPNRTSSLQYKVQPYFNSSSKANSLIRTNNTNNNRCKNLSSIDDDDNDYNDEEDDSSLYSAYTLSPLNSFNLNSSMSTTANINRNFVLNKRDTFKIESCYQSIGSSVYSSKSPCELYTTNLQSLIKLLDWKYQINGVPVWVFNTGLNPKRPKGLSLVIADKSTGFALWRLNNITYVNDFKWSKPGHITFKIYSHNLTFENNNNNNTNSGTAATLKKTKSASSENNENKSRPMSMRNSTSFCINQLEESEFSDLKLLSTLASTSFRANTSRNSSILKQNLNANSTISANNNNNAGLGPFLFAAIKFNSEFECSKFYDFYRNLFVDSANDDLFNPHYKQPITNKKNIIKMLYKKITKNSISSPCAFHHINSLTIVDEADQHHHNHNNHDNKSSYNSNDQIRLSKQHVISSALTNPESNALSSNSTSIKSSDSMNFNTNNNSTSSAINNNNSNSKRKT